MPRIPIHNLLAGQTLSAEERQRLLCTAARLARNRRDGHHAWPLSGRHLAIAVARPMIPSVGELETAATRAGARIAVINRVGFLNPREPERLGRMLGSLYDAVDCDALSPEEARGLQRLSGVPVFDGIASEGHPLRTLLPGLRESASLLSSDDAMAILLQAALLETIL